ncbi:MAG: bifunctional 4-hydroxy-2-oxoglutarate aldolase/2-dehydro-3-deoxy-phosphogluconate aldolase [Opitutaceae bacterium]|nr:bifunctional 4-hydroxy-2-oxoglutarate aldolase/2-dehydro-3-deoxy-phosphogluconate aldolase [Opitutaceae bacterium]
MTLKPMLPDSLAERLSRSGVAAVVTVENPDDAVPIARALLDGGVGAIELTFRTARAAEAIRRIRAEVPDILAGAGTLLTRAHVLAALEAGALFGVAPGCNPATLAAARECGLPFAPGVMTPTDIEIALEHGCRVLKYFPATNLAGPAALETMAAPFAHLGVRFIPLGGINLASLPQWLASPSVLCVGGSWLAPREVIQRQDWTTLRRNAGLAAEVARARK